jgi:hypothetical protein
MTALSTGDREGFRTDTQGIGTSHGGRQTGKVGYQDMLDMYVAFEMVENILR